LRRFCSYFFLARWVDMPNSGGILRLGGERLIDNFSNDNLNYAYMPFLMFTMPSDCRLHMLSYSVISYHRILNCSTCNL